MKAVSEESSHRTVIIRCDKTLNYSVAHKVVETFRTSNMLNIIKKSLSQFVLSR